MLSENIKALRLEKGLSQEELAKSLSVVRQTVSKWEKGLSVPDSEMLVRIAEMLDTSVSALLNEEADKKCEEPFENEKKRRRISALEITLLVLGSPIWISLLAAAVSVVISLYAVLWSVVVSVWAVFGALVACGFGFTAGGVIIGAINSHLSGLALIGAGLFSAGLSIFFFFGAEAVTKGAVWLTKMPFVIMKKYIKRGGRDEQN